MNLRNIRIISFITFMHIYLYIYLYTYIYKYIDPHIYVSIYLSLRKFHLVLSIIIIKLGKFKLWGRKNNKKKN